MTRRRLRIGDRVVIRNDRGHLVLVDVVSPTRAGLVTVRDTADQVFTVPVRSLQHHDDTVAVPELLGGTA